MNSRKYEEIKSLDFEQAIEILKRSSERDELVFTLLGVVQSETDYQKIQSLLLEFINHSDKWVTGAAIAGLGDLARIQRKLDVVVVKEKLSQLQKSRPELEGKITDALSDIDVFLK